jgi:hypothetical protein
MEKHVRRGLEARAVDNVVDTHIMAVRPPFAIVNDGVIVADELDDLGDDEGHALPLDALQGLLCVPCLTPELGGRAAMLHVAAKRNRIEEEASASSSLGAR